MLRRLQSGTPEFRLGQLIFLVTRKGEVLSGYRIAAILSDLVMLDRSPVEGSTKQGFTIKKDLLKPNWCEGRRLFYAGCTTREQAQLFAQRRVAKTDEPDT
jgi:hypothetical protein